MALGLFCSGIFHLLVFQSNCFPTKPSGSSAFPTASLEKYTHNEAYVTPTPFARDSVDVHRSWKTSKSTSERGFVEDLHINLDDVVPSLGQEVSENVSAKRKRVDDFGRVSKSSRFSKDSTSELDDLFDTDIRHSPGIDLNSMPPGTPDNFWSEDAFVGAPSNADSIILLPKMRKSTGDGHTALQKLGIRRSKNRNLIQNREPTSCITPTRDLILSPKSSILEVKRRKKSSLKNSKIGKSSSNAMLSENLKLFNSKFKSKKNEWMMHPEDQGTHWDTRGDFPPTEIADNLHKSPLNILQTTDNIDLSSTRKFTSNIQPFYASGIFKGVGSFHLINSPILLDIDHWFDGLKKQMYHNNKGSFPGEINCLIKRAQDDLTIGFLGCLCVFEFKKPGWTDLSTLLENGWNFMKSLLGQWEGINLEDVKKMKDKGLLTGQKFWSDSPLSNVKYLLSIHLKQRIPQALFLEIHMLWTSKYSHSMENQQLKRQHQEFFTLLKGVDSRSVGEDFYKIVCINSPDFQEYLSRKLSDSTQIYTKQKNNFGDSLKKIGIDYAKLELKEDIDHYFEKLNNEMTDTLFEESDVEDCSDSMRFSSPLALGHLQTKKKASERLKKAIDSAKFKVTFAFLGSLIEIYNKTLQPKLIEEVLQSGWHFLKEQFSTWKDYRLKPSHVVKNTHIVKMKPVTKLTEDAFEILHYLLKHHNQHTPLNCVHTLLNLWIHNLSSQTEAGKTLSFKIPSPIKKPLGYALKHPEKLFSENS
ncbi:hypothetical protein DFH28DRAFT_878842 [Melampsora americana]|nr:hypothetical protein DFH28DRAFT_878842 [Melampsora americana]